MTYAIISNCNKCNLGRLELQGACSWHRDTYKNKQMSIKN